MIRATSRLSRVNLATALAAGLLCAPAALASSFDYYLKLPPIEGDSGDKHKGEIEILSWSWGASQIGTGKVSKVEALTIKQKTAASAGGTEDINIGVGEQAAKQHQRTSVQHDLRTNVVARASA